MHASEINRQINRLKEVPLYSKYYGYLDRIPHRSRKFFKLQIPPRNARTPAKQLHSEALERNRRIGEVPSSRRKPRDRFG